jgi:hypothetical protein
MAREFLDIEKLSQLLCVSSKTLRNKYSDPSKCKQLPPRVVVPGIDRLLFDTRDVESWQNGLTRSWGAIEVAVPNVGNNLTPLSTEKPSRKRGRPTNLELQAQGRLN